MALNHESLLRASALRLKFGELWQAVADEISDRMPTRSPRQERFEYLGHVCEDVTTQILGFLDARSLAAASLTCRELRNLCTVPAIENHLWRPHCQRLGRLLALPRGSSGEFKRRFLRLQLLQTQAELRHFVTLSSLLNAVCQMPKGSVVGVLSNIGYFDDAAVAIAVSAHRQVAMSTVILSRTQDAITFRKDTDYVGPLTFFSQDNISRMITTANTALRRPNIPANTPGFIGYAVDLLRLEPAEEYMRFTFMLCAFRNLTVWRTAAAEAAARRRGLLPRFVLSVSVDAVANSGNEQQGEQLEEWFATGKLGDRSMPCSMACGEGRPRLTSVEALCSYLTKLSLRRDALRDMVLEDAQEQLVG